MKYPSEVLALAIPSRETYSQSCLAWDEKSSASFRKFSLFESQNGEDYVKGDPQTHACTITPATIPKDGGPGRVDVYMASCSCGWTSGFGPMSKVFEVEYAEHLTSATSGTSPIPADSTLVDESEAHLVTSYTHTEDQVRFHAPTIDIDLPVHVRESSPGKSHLFIDKQMPEDVYWNLLDAFVEAGLVEPGYVAASKRRHGTFLRLPDMTKAELPSVTMTKRKAMLDDPSKALREALEGMG